MYQQITPFTGALGMITLMIVLSCVVFACIKVGIEQRNKNYIISGVLALVLMVAFLPLAGFSFEQEEKKRSAMESNILMKYNEKYLWMGSPYLKDVEYDPPRKGEGGTHFNLTYTDDSTARVEFFFDSETGEPKPQCLCDLKRIEDFEIKVDGQ